MGGLCGLLTVAAMVLAGVTGLYGSASLGVPNPVLWLETLLWLETVAI